MQSPTGPHMEYRPPTQFSNPNVWSSEMPKSLVPCKLVDTATICFPKSPCPASSHDLAMRALAMVSCVVNVLLTITSIVFWGSSPSRTDSTWAPSTLLTKWQRMPRLKRRSAFTAMAGPKSEPPIPMFTTSVISPSACMSCTRSTKPSIRSRMSMTFRRHRVRRLKRHLRCWPEEPCGGRRGSRWCSA